MSKYQIAVVRGDGIGPEVCDSAVQVVTQAAGASRFDLVDLPAGAVHYQKTGTALPEETFVACAKADAILIVDELGVVSGFANEGVAGQMQIYRDAIAQVPQTVR